MEERLEQKIVYMQVSVYDLCLNICLCLQQSIKTSFSALSFFFVFLMRLYFFVYSEDHPQSQSKEGLQKKFQTLQDTWCLHVEC